MPYLICMSILGAAICLFLRAVTVLERGQWPSKEGLTPLAALRELLSGRR
jgi:hypothetical protein